MTSPLWPRRGAQRSKYDDGSGPVPGEALAAVRATYDRALAFMANVHEPIMNGARVLFYLIAKSLMVDEASTGLQYAEAVCGQNFAAVAGMYDNYEFPSTHEKMTATLSADLALLYP